MLLLFFSLARDTRDVIVLQSREFTYDCDQTMRCHAFYREVRVRRIMQFLTSVANLAENPLDLANFAPA